MCQGEGRKHDANGRRNQTSTEDLPHASHALRASLHPLLPTISWVCCISMPISEGQKLRLTELKALGPSLICYWQNQDLSSGLPGSLVLGKGSWLASLWEQSESPWKREGNGKGRGKWAGSTNKAQTAAREALPWKPWSMTASWASRGTRCVDASKGQIQGHTGGSWVILMTKGCLLYDVVPFIISVSYKWKITPHL